MELDYNFNVFLTYSSGEKEYLIKYVDFNTIIGVGKTLEEALKEAQENLKIYLDYCKDNSIEIPNPSLEEEKDYSGKITLRMSKTLHQKVDERARKEGISVNSLVNEALNSYLYEKDVIELLLDNAKDKLTEIAKDCVEIEIKKHKNKDISNI